MFSLAKAVYSFLSTEIHLETDPFSSQSAFKYNLKDIQGEAIVDEPITPNQTGRVHFDGTWWPARCDRAITINAGESVYVVGVRNITLIVEPASLK